MQEKLESQKATHLRVEYEPVAKMPSTICGNCTQFINEPPFRCKSVKQPIDFGGWCKRHKKKAGDDVNQPEKAQMRRTEGGAVR